MDWLSSPGRDGLLPRDDCFAGSHGLLEALAAADLLAALACLAIPVGLLVFAARRPGRAPRRAALLLGALILAGGLVRALDAWTIWHPGCGLRAGLEAASAVLWLAAAFAAWRLLALAAASTGEAAQSLGTTLAGIGAGLIATDAQGRVTCMNAIAERITGWTEAQARGQPFRQVWREEGEPAPPADDDPVRTLARRPPGVDAGRRVWVLSRTGTRTPVEVQLQLGRGGDGAIRGLLAVLRDKTGEDKAEEDRRRLAAIVESSNDAIIGKSLDGRITNWNRAAAQLFGYSEADILGKSIQLLIPPDRREEEMGILAAIFDGQTVPPFETVRLAKGGRQIEVSLTISPIRDGSGRIVGGSKILRDIGPQRRAEEARLRALRLEGDNRRIQESNRLKSQFLANMSHELRSPLNAIIGFSDLLTSEGVTIEPAQQRQFIGHIQTSGRHLLQLINDVLDLSKVESGKFEFFPEPVDLAALIRDVRAVLFTQLQGKRQALEVDVAPAVASVVVDPARLKQALFNYLSNAIKFTPEGGTIAVRASADGPDDFRIEVQDTGVGIADADLPRLFVEFQQLDDGYTKRHQGTGLGLALTRRLVQAQGGSVGVRSELGRGSTFHLVLPRHPAPAAPAAREAPAPGGAHVLVVEDDARERGRIADALARGGHRVDVAADAGQALRQAAENDYDGLTVDLTLAARGGFDVLAQIRGGQAERAPTVLAITVGDEAAGTGGFAVADVLAKPLHAPEVILGMKRLGIARRPGAQVMLIDDDPLACDLMGAALADLGIEALCFDGGAAALAALAGLRPSAIVLDLLMPGMDGFEVLDRLRREPAWRDIPVFIWTAMLLTEVEFDLLSTCAAAIVRKGGGDLEPLLERLRCWRSATGESAGSAR